MKVCIITGGHFSAHNAGLPIQAARLADHLVGKGVDVHYLARNLDPDFEICGYSLTQVKSPKSLHRFGFWTDTPWLLSRLRAIQPDVIYQRGLQAYTGISAFYARRRSCRFVFHIASDYDVIPYRDHDVRFLPGLPFIEARVGEYGLRNADVMIAQTQAQVRLLEQNYDRDAVVIPNFHSVPPPGQRKPDGPIEIVWIGNFKPLKRPELFVKLAEDLQDRCDIRFTMYGAIESNGYELLIERGKRLPRLNIAGPRSQDDVNQLLDRSHLLINTSMFEGFSNTFIEAWMRQVPVLTLGVNPDGLLDDGRLGLCAPDYDGLRSNLLDLVDNPARRQLMSESSRQIAIRNYSMSNADRLIDELIGS